MSNTTPSLHQSAPGEPYFEKFSLADLGVDQEALLAHVRPVYETLEWDMYDTARSAAQHPMRKRALANTLLERGVDGWSVTRVPTKPYVQPNHGAYDRVTPRVYPDVPEALTAHPEIIAYQRAIAERILRVRQDAKRMLFVLTFLRAVHDDLRDGQCALEQKAHHDGADFIVSAMVVNRVNLTPESGVSSVHRLDESLLLRTALQPGEGILQDDKNLMHHISDIRRALTDRVGFRDIFGVDAHILRDGQA
jgi:hypothetical protein